MDVKLTPIDPPREFSVGVAEIIQIKDCARIQLAPNEQVTFTTDAGREFDVVRKSWGYYATPSLNGRLLQFGLRAALVKSPSGRYFILLIEQGREADAQKYFDLEKQEIVCWLDSDEALGTLERRMAGYDRSPA